MKSKKPIAAGKSSFDLIDARKLFHELPLKKDTVFLDLGCGRGAYSMAAAKYMGIKCKIYAMDLWPEGISNLRQVVKTKKIKNIRAEVADVTRKVPMAARSVDVCLMATVLHDLIQEHGAKGAIKEVRRVLKPDGVFAVVEFKKIDGPPGPPRSIRLSPAELNSLLASYGFCRIKTKTLGRYNYLSIFRKTED